MGLAKRDANNVTTLLGVDMSDETTPVPVLVDSATGRLLVNASVSQGTQYTEGDTDTTITGTAILWEDGSDTLATVTAANPLPVDIGAGAITLGAGTAEIGKLAAGVAEIGNVKNSGTFAVQSTLQAGTASAGGVFNRPETSNGLSIFRSIDLDETEEDVKTSAGQVYGMWVSNTATSTRFLKFYNATAATVVVGTTTPVLTVPIPGNSSDDITGFFNSTHGIAFDTAICVAATTGVADNDTGAPAANDVIINIFYK